MIVGEGLIARRFIEYAFNANVVIIAPSHKNSGLALRDYEDEISQLEKAIKENSQKQIVVFSSTSVQDPVVGKSAYAVSMLRLEQFAVKNASDYLIVRVPQLIGGFEEETLINFLVGKILKEEKFDLWQKAQRNLLDVDDLFSITDKIIREKSFANQIITVANTKNVPVTLLVQKIEHFLGLKANYDVKDQGSATTIDTSKIEDIVRALDIRFDETYIYRALVKYYNWKKGIVRKISLVVPTYYAEEGIEEFHSRCKKVLDGLAPRFTYEMIFVNDGSKDKTFPKLIELSKKDPAVKIVNFARNFGNQYAITAGIDRAEGDAVVIIDDDLQDPPEIILNMLAVWDNGYDIVYGVRRKRKEVNFFFDYSAKAYYRLIDYLSEVKIPVDTGDFRLVDKRAIHYLRMMKEENRYFRGMVAWVGFRQIGLYYDRDARYAGESNFTLKKYFKFAFDGLSSFSEKPLYLTGMLGLVITCLSLLFTLYIIYSKIANPEYTVRGWTSLVAFILFFGGIQLLSIGVIGLYVGKIYREVKRRPIYIVESEHGFNHQNNQETTWRK